MANERRLIDATPLIEKFSGGEAMKSMSECIHDEIFVSALKNAPVVDAVEVVHGRWIWNEENECWVCSNCEMSALNNYRGNSTDSNYCHNCGAKMDEHLSYDK